MSVGGDEEVGPGGAREGAGSGGAGVGGGSPGADLLFGGITVLAPGRRRRRAGGGGEETPTILSKVGRCRLNR